MHVIIIGAGEVGQYLAQILVEENHDVVIIEQDERVLQEVDQKLDVAVVHGSGISREALSRARIERADLLLAITKIDEVNLVAAMTAERVRPECRTVARVRDPRYLHGNDAIKAGEYGVDFVVGPEQAVAEQIVELLEYGGPGPISQVADGRVVMMEVPVVPHSPLAYSTAGDLSQGLSATTRIIARSTEEGLQLSAGEDRFELGQRVFVLCPYDEVGSFLEIASADSRKPRRVLLVGAGHVGLHVARHLQALRLQVTLLESDADRAHRVAAMLGKVNVIHGDATDTGLLTSLVADGQDAVAVLLSDDERSLWIAVTAKHLGATKVIARAGKRAYAPVAYKHGIDAVISPRRAMADAILRFARRGRVASTTMLGDHEAELIEFVLGKKPGAKLTEKPVAKLELPEGARLELVVRRDQIIVPDAELTLAPGDRVLVVALRGSVGKLDGLFG